MKKISAKVSEVGLINTVAGACRRQYYKHLQKKEGFDSWHITPYELRGYLQATAAYINAHNATCVVDIGCGLGELERHLTPPHRIGMDISEDVISVAKRLDPRSVYLVGSFDEYTYPGHVDYLVTLGFMHGGTEEMWISPYTTLLTKYPLIQHVIVDTVPDSANGSHRLDFKKILPASFSLEDRLGPFLNGRYIEVWKRSTDSRS